ncbi:hypothetical protein KP509_39G009900 [Ceratopteris richardii]|uniref:Protein kinase domain-containing protein n=1 Tax=Ceratopteris richardii TaxID=49495 RepID=A0A8T2PYL1_CERRI|nr:hypothetical protein KP509_39G009900 [Ceratopteris richardii]
MFMAKRQILVRHMLLILVLYLIVVFSCAFALNWEGQLLLRFKSLIVLDPLGVLSNWNPADADPCRWSGVGCSNTSSAAATPVVVTISLPRAELQGSLAPELGSLAHLRHLNLHHNHLSGPIPGAIFNATQLQSLFLFSNNFSGSVPPDVSRLTSLQSLDLSRNSLSGSLPASSLANCTRLFYVSLAHNSLSGRISDLLGSSLSALRSLDLSYNSLSGTIPETLGELSSLIDVLDLSHNQLSGVIPATLSSLPENVSVDVSYNNLSGPIPREGALAAQSVSAFLGNPGLCGPPLSVLCSEPPSPVLNIGREGSRGLSRGAIAAIAIGDVAGVALICIVFLYCYWRAFSHRKTSSKGLTSSNTSSIGPTTHRPSWLCAKTASVVTDAMPEAFDQGELIALDSEVTFDLDELLKASAYVLGKSSVGIIYKVILSDELTVAVRRLGDSGAHRFKEFQAEVEAIGRIRHPNIVRLRAYYWAVDEKLLVYNYIPNGNLSSILNGQTNSEPLRWAARLKIAKGAARGLAFLHEQGTSRKFAHGDIKPSNVLLDAEMEPYIADFGLHRLLNIVGSGVPSGQGGKTSVSSRSSTGSGVSFSAAAVSPEDLQYQAPETALSKGNKPTHKGDVYSLGMVLLQLLTGKLQVLSPASEMELSQWIHAALQGKEPLLRIVDAALVDEMHRADDMLAFLKVALACVTPQPDQRPSMRVVYDSLSRIATLPVSYV